MPAPYSQTYSPAAKAAAHTAYRDLLDAHATDPATITVHAADDTLLGMITLAKPCMSIDGGTGVASLIEDTREPAATAGTAAYAVQRDGAGTAHHSLPCEAGTEPVAGKCVLNTLTIAAGAPIELVSWDLG